jgi:hypothetical protein
MPGSADADRAMNRPIANSGKTARIFNMAFRLPPEQAFALLT